jgi:uncharacterized protein (DUF4415 family)
MLHLHELDALSTMTDDQIDTTDIPEVIDWGNAKRGLFYRPIKQQITLRLDAVWQGLLRQRRWLFSNQQQQLP